MAVPEWVLVTLKVVLVLDELSVPYVIGGSVAGIVHGTPRTTFDADLIVDLKLEHIDRLTAALNDEFYIDELAVREAVTRQTSFNVIHQETMFKVDMFIAKTREFDRAQLAHRVQVEFSRDPIRRAWILSPEDIILAKLEWFKAGGAVSERQWRDVVGIFKVQSDKLNLNYMHDMARTLKISELLEKAIAASRDDSP